MRNSAVVCGDRAGVGREQLARGRELTVQINQLERDGTRRLRSESATGPPMEDEHIR